ncbi:Uncharacterized protein Adt_11809 [Abeliophyllum distichum]|uniref:Uncharacterized protein n=1 Tax=Abeliophyllum distichum TaxID=126358 RepID=A0ABD1UNX0_9LAMI
MKSRRSYVKAAKEEPMESWQVHGHRSRAPQILFTKEDEAGTHYPHCDALVVHTVVAKNGLEMMLVNEESVVNILFNSAFHLMDVHQELTVLFEPLFDFMEDSLIP